LSAKWVAYKPSFLRTVVAAIESTVE
jgi:hypothetical protein